MTDAPDRAAVEAAIATAGDAREGVERYLLPRERKALDQVFAAARAYLAGAQRVPSAEPVAWMYSFGDKTPLLSQKHMPGMRDVPGWLETPLYTAPAAPAQPEQGSAMPTLCWNCNCRYQIVAAFCPHCHYPNANVDLKAVAVMRKLINEIAALRAQPGGAVPREPTQYMEDAGYQERRDGGDVAEIWRAMYDAAHDEKAQG